jgi:hypothetical protein
LVVIQTASEPEDYSFGLPHAPDISAVRNPGSEFGIRWWGDVSPIFRLYFGVDIDLVRWLEEKGLTTEQAQAFYDDART